MTHRAELGGSVKRLEERPFVKRRLGLDELIVDPLQDGIVAVGKGIMDRFVDGVIAVAARGVDVGYGVTDGASDAGVGCRVVEIVEVRIVELARQERNLVVTAGTPPRPPGDSVRIVPHRDLAGLANAESVGRVVK